MQITSSFQFPKIYEKMNIKCEIPEAIPVEAKNRPLEAENVILQITKTNNTPYQFKNIKVNIDDNLFLPKISMLNELRRIGLKKVEEYALNNIKRSCNKNMDTSISYSSYNCGSPKISVLLNLLNKDYNYNNLNRNISNIYIPLKYFTLREYENTLKNLSKLFNIYIYMPTIVKSNYRNLMISNINKTLEKLPIKGFVISNLGNLELLKLLHIDISNFKIVTNYTLNVFNNFTVQRLKKIGVNKFTPSVELDKNSILNLCNCDILPKELIVYSKLPLMNIRYCLLGKSNSCYPECTAKCNSYKVYELKDRLNMKFRVLPDNIQTVTTILNCKTLSISPESFNADSVRIDILDEDIGSINDIVDIVMDNKRCEGKDFTNGNLNRDI